MTIHSWKLEEFITKALTTIFSFRDVGETPPWLKPCLALSLPEGGVCALMFVHSVSGGVDSALPSQLGP